MPAALETAFHAAHWLSDAALCDDCYLQPQALQRLLFLAQAYYAVTTHGRRMMPAVFVADDAGPLEPNVHAALALGRPRLEAVALPDQVEAVLRGVWGRFGMYAADRLDRLSKDTVAYREARARGHRAEIEHRAIWWSFAAEAGPPGAAQVVRPTLMRTQTGRPVAVTRWQPAASSATATGTAR